MTVFALRAVSAIALVACAVTGTGAQERDISIGASIVHPGAISGVWEMPVASGKTIGLSINLQTKVDGSLTTLRGVAQKIDFIRIVTYAREAGRTTRTFWNDPAQGTLVWHGDRIRFHERGSSSIPDVDFDLAFDAANSRWSGTFGGYGYIGHVDLVPPGRTESGAPIGLWKVSFKNGAYTRCTHIAMGDDGRFVIWSDSISLAGIANLYAPGSRPATTDQMWGEFDWSDPAETQAGNVWHFRIDSGLYGEAIAGTLDDTGTIFSGGSTHSGNGYTLPNNPPRPFTWQLVANDACVEG